mgnify:CR=1 FL=1
MNGWTKKRKVDTFMGILLQVYCFFPWMRINRKWNTIHMYVIKTFQENDYIKMYNHNIFKTAYVEMETFTGSCVYIFTDVNIPDFASEYRIV